MSSTYGEKIHLSIFGQSHGKAIGMVLDGVPAGLAVDFAQLQSFLNRRAPGNSPYSTPRKEADMPNFISGIFDGYTCGAPIAATIENTNTRSGDYSNLKFCPRPGHADYTAQVKYNGYQDAAGGGHFSGRLTAPLCIAGGLCKQWLAEKGIHVTGHILSIGGVTDGPLTLDPIDPQIQKLQKHFPVLNPEAGEKMLARIENAAKDGDSVGGIIECIVTGLPAGLGEPMFGGMESKIAQIVYGIPAVKGVSFGSGFACANMRGSAHNDVFVAKNGKIETATNYAGGILGGITNGMPLIFQTAIKPTPSISAPQETLNTQTMKSELLSVKGRHDPCIVPRAVAVIEAAAALAVYDAILCRGNEV